MKQFILLLGVLSLFVFDMVGQGNLQFSRVVFMEMEGTTPPQSISTHLTTDTLIVPPGKVLKIESTSVSYETINPSNPHPFPIYITGYTTNAGLLFLNDKAILNVESAHSNIVPKVVLPIWINEGIYTLKLVYRANNTNEQIISRAFVSGIEFNITPP